MNIQLSSTISRNTQILSSKMDNELIMMSIQNSEYYGINPVGAQIWNMLEKARKVEWIIETLVYEYDVSEEQCLNDITPFLLKLAEKGIIIIEN